MRTTGAFIDTDVQVGAYTIAATRETPTGTIDGSNASFTLAAYPTQLCVFYQIASDGTITVPAITSVTNETVVLTTAPPTGAHLVAFYV